MMDYLYALIFLILNSSLFWKVYDAKCPDDYSVIMGTVHLPLSAPGIFSMIDEQVSRYDYVYTETALGGTPDPYLAKAIMLPPDHDRSQYISDRQWERMRRIFLKSYKKDIAHMAAYRPMIQVSQFYEHMLSEVGAHKMDHYIWTSASQQEKTVAGIESNLEQARTMMAIPLEYDYQLLKKWGRSIRSTNRQMKRLIDVYQEGDIDRLHKLSVRSIGAMRQLLLTDRNYVMTDRIHEHIQKSAGFFTFGAGHLGGYHGVLRGLKNKGLMVRPIPMKK